MITSFLCVSFYSLKHISMYLVSFSHLSEVERALPSPYNGWGKWGSKMWLVSHPDKTSPKILNTSNYNTDGSWGKWGRVARTVSTSWIWAVSKTCLADIRKSRGRVSSRDLGWRYGLRSHCWRASLELSGQACRQENIAERKEKQRLMERGPCFEARKKSSEDGTRRDQRSEWEKRWKNFPSQKGKNS